MRYDPAPNVPGAWFVVSGIMVFVPVAATAPQLCQAIKTLSREAAARLPSPPKGTP